MATTVLARTVPLITTLAIMHLSVPATGQCTRMEDQKLVPADGAASDWFAGWVAMDGDVLVSAAAGADGLVQDLGAAYVYRHDGTRWAMEQRLMASDGAPSDVFGNDLAVSGNVAMIGARLSSPSGLTSGSAYAFRFDGISWVEEQKLVPADGEAGDLFADSVAVDGTVAVFGATFDDDAGPDAGAAYVYRHDGTRWLEEQKLLPSDPGAYQFGYSSSVSGDTIVVGSAWENSSTGAAYVFRFNGSQWVEEARLVGSDSVPGSSFGRRVAVDGNTLIAGAPFHNSATGAAYVFRHDGSQWVEQQKLLPPDLATGDFLASAVDLSKGLLVLPALSAQAGRGAAYVYRFNDTSWVLVQKLIASDGAANDWLGGSVAVSQGRVVCGASGADVVGPDSGAAYSFDVLDVALDVNQNTAPAGSNLAFTACGGRTGSLAGLFVVDVNSSPMFLALGFGTFDAQGEWKMGGTVPVGLSGLTVQFQALGFWTTGKAGLSNGQSVVFP